MIEVVKSGTAESDKHLMELAERYGQVVFPTEDDDLDLTHWWVVREDGAELLYLGTPDTFSTYVQERNGGVQ
ncbi:MAG TPA: hypothetical protein VGK29_22770 [Paludibaculum sp.]|jgi:hypothetical protein